MHRSYNRNTAAYTCLKEVVYIFPSGNLQKLCPVCGNKLLVRRYNALSRFKKTFCKFICRVKSAHNFRNNAYFVIVKYVIEFFCKKFFFGMVVKIANVKNVLYIHAFTIRTAAELVTVGLNYVVYTTSNSTVAHYCNLCHSYASLIFLSL